MKKQFFLAAAIFVSMSLLSCSCTKEIVEPPPPPPPPPSPEVKVNIVSPWLEIPLTAQFNGSNSWLEGSVLFTSVVSYNNNTHKKFAFVTMQGREGFVYRAMPADYFTVDGTLKLDYKLSFSDFTVTIKNVDEPSRLANTQNLTSFKYRWIVISDEVYRQHNIDWNDYLAIKNALSSSIYFPE